MLDREELDHEILNSYSDMLSGAGLVSFPFFLRKTVTLFNLLISPFIFLQDVLIKSFIGTMRSCGFLATFVSFFQAPVCSQRNIFYAIHGHVPEWVENILLHKGYYWMSGFATCLSLFIEEKKRRGELAMYVLPRGLESLWSILRRRSYVPFVPGGEVLLTGLGLSSE